MRGVFLKTHRIVKDGKAHIYYSLCESLRVSRKRVLQRRVLHLGELNTTQLERWQRTIEVIEEDGRRHPMRLFTDRHGSGGPQRRPRMWPKCFSAAWWCGGRGSLGRAGWDASCGKSSALGSSGRKRLARKSARWLGRKLSSFWRSIGSLRHAANFPYGNWGAGTGWMVNFNSAGCCDDQYANNTTGNLVSHRRGIMIPGRRR